MLVAAIIDTAQVSGPGRQLAALASCLRPMGVELRVVTFHRTGRSPSPYLDYLERAGVRYEVLEESGPLDLGLPVRLHRLLSSWSPNVVQTHGYRPTALAYVLRRAGARWPWIAFFHGATTENRKVRLYHWLDRRMRGSADRVIVMSRTELQEQSHLGARVSVLHNAAIPLPPEPAAPLPPIGGRDLEAPRIGVVGRLSPEKGVDVFLEACTRLVGDGVAFSAIVAGDGPERRNLEQLRDDLGLADRAHFVGGIDGVQSLYASLDLLVIPSRSEGLPNVLLEALRADVPVVATRVGAIPEVLGGSPAGVLVPAGAPDALAEAIAGALGLKGDAASRAARREVVARFSVERRAQAHLQIYEELLCAR
jgi:glycosyltransferase involved in cell wall biosynthesis